MVMLCCRHHWPGCPEAWQIGQGPLRWLAHMWGKSNHFAHSNQGIVCIRISVCCVCACVCVCVCMCCVCCVCVVCMCAVLCCVGHMCECEHEFMYVHVCMGEHLCMRGCVHVCTNGRVHEIMCVWGICLQWHAAIHAGIVTMCHLSILSLWLWPVWSALLDDSFQPSPLKPLLGLHRSKVGGWGVNPTVCLCSKLCKLLLGVIRCVQAICVLGGDFATEWSNFRPLCVVGEWCMMSSIAQCACSGVRYPFQPTEIMQCCVMETSKSMDGVWMSGTVDSHGW